MDFGLGRFLEMFEERFGRLATNLLLIVIALAVFGGCVKLIYENLVVPLITVAVAVNGGQPLSGIFSHPDLWNNAIGAAIGVGGGIVYAVVSRVARERRLVKEVEKIRAQINSHTAALRIAIEAATNPQASPPQAPEPPNTPEKT
jgi:uncharacterized membrane protein YccC